MPTRRVSSVILLALALSVLAGLALTAAPAEAQCLPAGECDALKQQLRDLRQEARKIKSQLREIRDEAMGLPPGSEERRALRQQARQLRRQLRGLRHDAMPLRQSYRQGCRGC